MLPNSSPPASPGSGKITSRIESHWEILREMTLFGADKHIYNDMSSNMWKKFWPKISKGSPLWSSNSFSVYRQKLAQFKWFPPTLIYQKIEKKIRKILHIYELRIACVKNCYKIFIEKIIFFNISGKKMLPMEHIFCLIT